MRAVGPAACSRERYVSVACVVCDVAVEALGDVWPRVEAHVFDRCIPLHCGKQPLSIEGAYQNEVVLEHEDIRRDDVVDGGAQVMCGEEESVASIDPCVQKRATWTREFAHTSLRSSPADGRIGTLHVCAGRGCLCVA